MLRILLFIEYHKPPSRPGATRAKIIIFDREILKLFEIKFYIIQLLLYSPSSE